MPPIARADARPASGDAKGEDASSFRGALTLTLLRDTPYTLEVSALIPHGPPTGQPRPRQSELLSTLDLPAGTPGRHLSVSAPFENCKDPLFGVVRSRAQPGGGQK